MAKLLQIVAKKKTLMKPDVSLKLTFKNEPPVKTEGAFVWFLEFFENPHDRVKTSPVNSAESKDQMCW